MTRTRDLVALRRREGAAHGFVKIRTDEKGGILGATIVARGAGELLQPLVLAKANGLSLGEVAGAEFPYPTFAEGVERASDEYMGNRLGRPSGRVLRRIVQCLE